MIVELWLWLSMILIDPTLQMTDAWGATDAIF